MVVLLIIYVVFLVTREGDNTVSVDTIEKNITKAVKLEGMKKGTTQDLKKYYSLNANDYEGISLYIPDDVMSVNEILVIKVKRGVPQPMELHELFDFYSQAAHGMAAEKWKVV